MPDGGRAPNAAPGPPPERVPGSGADPIAVGLAGLCGPVGMGGRRHAGQQPLAARLTRRAEPRTPC
jgi:hypothetical protein